VSEEFTTPDLEELVRKQVEGAAAERLARERG
jgi:hypothetical protein